MFPLLTVGGFLAGIVNTLAGGGSLLTLPLMIFCGVPAKVANGTNRIGIVFQCVAATQRFHSLGVLPVGLVARLAAPALVGTLIGAQIAVAIDQRWFRIALGCVMLVMGVLVAVDRARWLKEPTDEELGMPGAGLYASFFALGVYGGFLQAGAGILMLGILVVGAKLDLVRANAVKVGVALVYTVLALGIFVWNGQVDFVVGASVAVGQTAGGAVGAHLTVWKGSRGVRWALVAVIAVSATKLLIDAYQG